MALGHSPKIVTSNLLINLDFKNPKRFTTTLGSGNLVQTPIYDNTKWSNVFPANATLTTGIDAPDGSTNAVRLTCNNTGNALLRVSFNSFTPNGTDTYATTFWVRKISGTSANSVTTDLHDGNPTADYKTQLVTNEWVRVSATGVPTATAKTFVDLYSDSTADYVLDFWGVKVENVTAATNPYEVKDTLGNYVFNIYRPQYSSIDEDSITFTRTASTPKHGSLAFTTATGSLAANTFLFNDHTWEIWFKINDINPGNYDAAETFSTLALYLGYHCGFIYSASSLAYQIHDSVSGIKTCASWTLGTSGTQVVQGQWYQAVVVRSGNVFTPYLNGASVGTGFTQTTSYVSTSNTLCIGATQLLGSGAGSYIYYGKNTVSNMKMYNRALSASEIKQNFNALRSRYSI